MSQPAVSTADELDDESFLHPSWPELWTHPEFMVSHDERRACNFKWAWGFIIYRTFYTPESDEVWASCLDKISRYIHWEIDHIDGKRYDGQDPFPETIIKETYKSVILEDRERWDGASWDQLCAEFNAHLGSLGVEVGDNVPRFTACLVIDGKCLQSIMRAYYDPEDQRGGSTMGMVSRMGFVGIIDPSYSESNSYCTNLYQGYMRVQIDSLFDLAARQLTYFSMHEICPSVFSPAKVPVYNGGGGYEDDQ